MSRITATVLIRRILLSFALAGLSLLYGLSPAWAQQTDGPGLSASVQAQIAALQAEKVARTPAQKKLDSQLVYAVKINRNQAIAQGVTQLQPSVQEANGRALVDIKSTVSPALLALIADAGGTIVSSHASLRRIRAWLPLDALEAIAGRGDVQFIRPADIAMTSRLSPRNQGSDDSGGIGSADKPTTNAGSVLSEGDAAHAAALARTQFGVDGTGIKVGVLSDGVNTLAASKSSGNLPADVTVLPGQAGNGDEGTAMLEIVHDIAPGAQLFFATGFNGAATMAQNIRALRTAGCDIIIDDITYGFDDNPFQDGLISQAVNDVSADGALFFSSAANSGNKNDGTSGTYEGDFLDGGATAAPISSAGRVHDFGGATFDSITLGSNATILYWADPLGGSSNDYDLYLLNAAGTSIVRSSTNVQNGTQDPLESFGSTAAGQRLVVTKFSGADRFFHIDTLRGRLNINTQGSTRGHNASGAPNAFSVAATDAQVSAPNAFSGGATNPVESFSSDGPRRIFFNATGAAITPGNFSSTGGQVLQKPDITAADGVRTATPGFERFFGTSAAAPHAGALSALLMQFNSSLSPTQIRNLMQGTALDIEDNGVDRDSGFGIIMANRFLASAAGVSLNFNSSAVDGSAGNGNSTIDPNECNLLHVSLFGSMKNGPFTNITATLSSSTSGVLIAQPNSAYPDIPSLGTGTNLTPFQVSTSSAFMAGTPINFTLNVTYDGGSDRIHFTMQTGILPNSSVNGNLDSGDATQTGRLNRFSPASSCGTVKANPGLFATTGARAFDSYTFTNGGGDACVTVSLNNPNGTTAFAVAYAGSFNPANPSANYLADMGSSATNASMSFDVAAGQTVVIVVHAVNPGDSVPGYTLTVGGLISTAVGDGTCSTPGFLVVTTNADEDDGTSDPNVGSGTSLREAINFANSDPDPSTITFDIPGSSPHTIALLTALPDLSTDIHFDNSGAAAEAITIARSSGAPGFNIFTLFKDMTSGPTVSISTLTLSNGSGNATNLGGGAIFNALGTLIINNCTLSNNSANFGGAIANSGGTLLVTNSTFSNNRALGTNVVQDGGGVLDNYGNGSATFASCTLTDNSAPDVASGTRGGLWIENGTLTLSNTIVSGNATQDIQRDGGTITSGGYNLVGVSNAGASFSAPGDQTSITDPKLGPLQNNGGPTFTHALLAGSPAIDKGKTSLTLDQRGLTRPVDDPNIAPATDGDNNDIGAVELQSITNAAPTIANLTLNTKEDTAFTFATGSFDAGFSDPNGDTLQVVRIVSLPANGALTLNSVAVTANQEIARADLVHMVYAPNGNFNGSDSFNYNASDGTLFAVNNATVTLQVLAVNDVPSFTIGANQTVDEDSGPQVLAGFLSNISAGPPDENTQTLTFNLTNDNNSLFATQPAVAPNGTLSYTPASNANGVAHVIVILKDNGGTANGGVDSSAGQMFTITVSAVNDAPIANDQALSTFQGTALNITLTASDIDNDPLTFTVQSGPSNGTLSGSAPNLTYTPQANFTGVDSFTFKTNDGKVDSNLATITLRVLAANNAPIAQNQNLTTNEDTPKAILLTASDSENDSLSFRVVSPPKNGTLSGSVPNLTYTPNADFNGSDSFSFVANDGKADSNLAIVTLQVLATNDAPVAQGQKLQADNSKPLGITLSASDADNDALTFGVGKNLPNDSSEAGKGYGPIYGTLSGTAPNLIYIAPKGYVGRDVFTFYVSDGTTTSRQAKIEILVEGARGVSAGNDSYDLILGPPNQQQKTGIALLSTGVFRISAPGVLANDFRGGIDKATPKLATALKNGRVRLNADGSFDYLPSNGFAGTDEFTYSLSDGRTSATARVRLNVLDRRAPELRFDTPANGSVIKTIDEIKGRVRDRQSGVQSVTLLWRRFDGKFWNGSAWINKATPLVVQTVGTNWKYDGNLPKPGDSLETDLLDGNYDLQVTAVDKSGNSSRINNLVTVDNRIAQTPEFSNVRLSSAGASSEQNTIALRFTGAMDNVAARDTMNYAIEINGIEIQIGAVSYASNIITLSGFDLSANDEIELRIDGLRDVMGKPLNGGTIRLVAR